MYETTDFKEFCSRNYEELQRLMWVAMKRLQWPVSLEIVREKTHSFLCTRKAQYTVENYRKTPESMSYNNWIFNSVRQYLMQLRAYQMREKRHPDTPVMSMDSPVRDQSVATMHDLIADPKSFFGDFEIKRGLERVLQSPKLSLWRREILRHLLQHGYQPDSHKEFDMSRQAFHIHLQVIRREIRKQIPLKTRKGKYLHD